MQFHIFATSCSRLFCPSPRRRLSLSAPRRRSSGFACSLPRLPCMIRRARLSEGLSMPRIHACCLCPPQRPQWLDIRAPHTACATAAMPWRQPGPTDHASPSCTAHRGWPHAIPAAPQRPCSAHVACPRYDAAELPQPPPRGRRHRCTRACGGCQCVVSRPAEVRPTAILRLVPEFVFVHDLDHDSMSS